MLGLPGVTTIEDRTAVQVCVVVAGVRLSLTALTVADPVPTQSNSCVLLRVPLETIAELLVLQLALAVTFCVEPSEYVSVAVYCTPPVAP